MPYILLGFSFAGLLAGAFFMFFDQGRWFPAHARRAQEKPTKGLLTWTERADSVASGAGETPVHEARQAGLDNILEARFGSLNNSETSGADIRFQWGKYTLRELESNFAGEIPSLENEPRRARLR